MSADERRVSPGAPVACAAAVAFACSAPGGPGFGDAGELGAAAQSLGVPHPTGFPVDMLVLRAGALLPLGSIAFRQNLTVALISAGALGLLAGVTARACRRAGLAGGGSTLAGLFAALSLGTWATFLGTALTVEVYSTALATALLAMWLPLARPASAPRELAVLSGVSVSMHVVARLIVGPVWLFAAARSRPRARGWGAMAALAALGAATVVYLPLASLRQPPLDWGDPETLGRLWEHLSAGRIRVAFDDALARPRLSSAAVLGRQLAELWPALVAAVPAAWLGARRAPALVLVPVGVVLLDAAYALAVNPMGVGDRQVGHAAGAALSALGGIGLALLWERSRGPAGKIAVASLAGGLCLGAWVAAPAWPGEDPEVETELLGSGGTMLWLPPRAVAVCSSDDVCAGAMFALHAEGVRPDVVVVPGQHLWEPTVRAQVADLLPGSDLPKDLRPGTAVARANLAQRVVHALATREVSRPVLWEAGAAVAPTGVQLVARNHGPWLSRGPGRPGEAARTLGALEEAYRARVDPRPAGSSDARNAWSRAFGAVGRGALDGRAPAVAVAAFQGAVEAAPDRSVAWSNLAVAEARAGDVAAAVVAAARAVELGPSQPTAWVNLVRFLLASGERERAVEALRAAGAAGVSDTRLEGLREALQGPDRLPKYRIGGDR